MTSFRAYKLPILILAVTLAAFFAWSQTSVFGGIRNAAGFAYGLAGVPDGPLVVSTGNAAIGSQTITIQWPTVGIVQGTPGSKLMRIALNTPIIVGAGAATETVTPTAVTCATPTVRDTCQITATFTQLHGRGSPIRSGTCGLMEAVNAAHFGGGGLVAVDAAFIRMGCSTTTITSATGFTDVSVLDWTGTTTAKSYTAASNGGALAATAISLY